ncbi:FtsB family cell division protein [Salisediminibacterium halotolerans]|uniref:Cell division protein DivIC n=1 Tax=Salisediminibacterium halotolerans TaxID=517425 RepID=A0A1H9VSX8_9BACI|nr:septum formation initiator family protein [Salisediminibacterium haloalkalitolerans]SES24487.1 cell division protein DivIC [Salisediminibacterium haloalkalitolerans]
MDQPGKNRIREWTEELERKRAREEEQRRKRRRGLVRRLSVFGVIMLLFTAASGYTYYDQKQTLNEQERQYNEHRAELAELEEKEEELALEIKRLQEPEYIAEIARRDYFLSNSDETLFQLPRDDSDQD